MQYIKYADNLLTSHVCYCLASTIVFIGALRLGVQFQTDADLARLAGDIATTIFHPVGTTKMGREDDPMAVVDARLRVRGPGGLVAGLRVVDAGVMPVITSGNTNSPTLMVAEKAAQWIFEDAARARAG